MLEHVDRLIKDDGVFETKRRYGLSDILGDAEPPLKRLQNFADDSPLQGGFAVREE